MSTSFASTVTCPPYWGKHRRLSSSLQKPIVVPAANVLFLGDPPESAVARLELALAASDELGGLSPIRSREVSVVDSRNRPAGA